MTGGPLLLVMLLVSWTSLILQSVAMIHLRRQRATYHAEHLAGNGYVRTAACRVLAACIYVTVALFQATGTRFSGGPVTPEALIVLTSVQLIWIINSALDIRVRRQLRKKNEDSHD